MSYVRQVSYLYFTHINTETDLHEFLLPDVIRTCHIVEFARLWVALPRLDVKDLDLVVMVPYATVVSLVATDFDVITVRIFENEVEHRMILQCADGAIYLKRLERVQVGFLL